MFRRRSLYVALSATISTCSVLYMANRTSAVCESEKPPLDCAKPSCNSKIDMFKASMKAASSSSSLSKVDNELIGCPSDKDELGKSSWNLIHSLAANYPDNPNLKEQEAAIEFFYSLALLYPCPYCAKDLSIYIKKYPPNVKSRKELVLWVCEMHNDVNKKLSKPIIKCDINSLDLRWLTGNPKCWQE